MEKPLESTSEQPANCAGAKRGGREQKSQTTNLEMEIKLPKSLSNTAHKMLQLQQPLTKPKPSLKTRSNSQGTTRFISTFHNHCEFSLLKTFSSFITIKPEFEAFWSSQSTKKEILGQTHPKAQANSEPHQASNISPLWTPDRLNPNPPNRAKQHPGLCTMHQNHQRDKSCITPTLSCRWCSEAGGGVGGGSPGSSLSGATGRCVSTLQTLLPQHPKWFHCWKFSPSYCSSTITPSGEQHQPDPTPELLSLMTLISSSRLHQPLFQSH